jgi:hypothetical protein
MTRVYLPKGTDKKVADKLRDYLATKFKFLVYMSFDRGGIHFAIPREEEDYWNSIVTNFLLSQIRGLAT